MGCVMLGEVNIREACWAVTLHGSQSVSWVAVNPVKLWTGIVPQTPECGGPPHGYCLSLPVETWPRPVTRHMQYLYRIDDRVNL